MNVSRSLTFLWTPVSLTISIIALLAAAGVCFAAARRSGYRRSLVLLEVFRFGIVCVAVLLFNQPEWIEEFRPEGKPSVAVLWDGSPSMETRDVVLPGRTGTAPIARHEAISELTTPSSWDDLRGRMDVHVEGFASERPGHGTDLFEPLNQAPDKFRNLRAVVLASDGDWNASG
jgi:hypothetical protein